jgi:hypothetical protein
MNAVKKRYIRTGIFVTVLSLACVACQTVDPLIEELKLDRKFTPTEISTNNGQTQATIRWSASLFSSNAVPYELEISKSETFAVIEYSLTTTSLEAVVTNTDIDIKQDHYARVRAKGEDASGDSGWLISGVFRITGEQIFLPITEADLAYNGVTLKWTIGGDVTKVTITPNGGSTTEFTISEDEKTAGAKAITGLFPAITYTAEIFNGTTSRGTTTFTTFSLDVPEAELTIYLDADDVFAQTTFDTLTKASVTFVFAQGSVFGGSTALVLKGNTDFNFFGVPGANKPILAFNGFTLPTVGGKIKFENVTLTGYEYIDGVENTANKRSYIFNQSLTSTTSEVVFENCIIRNFANTPFRIQSANIITVDKVLVNNCTIYDISASQTYAFIHSTVATGKVDNIEITNSTFYNIRVGLIRHDLAPSSSLTVSNCTIHDISDNTRALIDYNAQAVTSFTFTANIIGKTKTTDNTARGIRIAGASVSVPSSSYITADYTTANNPIGGASSYPGLGTDLFNNPAAGDFTFKDTNFAGKSTSGDPRWRQ